MTNTIEVEIIRLEIGIESLHKSKIVCLISDKNDRVRLEYFPETGSIMFAESNHIVEIIRKYQFQFEKVIRSAIKGDISEGQSIQSVFIEDFNFLNNEGYIHFILMDRRDGKLDISTRETGMKDIHKIFADGSFTSETKQSGYGGFIVDQHGKREVYSKSFVEGGSNLMELLAVTEGLQRLKAVNKIQVNTDSRFVIRGLVQWVHFWKYNNWQTAYDCEVKYAEEWKVIDKLCEGKLLEFNWIKGHSGHEEQDFCHHLAQSAASLKVQK